MDPTDRADGAGGGKLILFGEHAVVYGVSAIVAGLGTGAKASAEFASQTTLTLTNGLTSEVLARVTPDDDQPIGRAFRAMLGTFETDNTVAVDVAIHVPIGSGLGSSAAMAVAVSRAMGALLEASADAVTRAVEASEQVFHGSPSGIDQAAAMCGGVFRFRRGETIQPLDVRGLRLLVCAAQEGASTAKMVGAVGELDELLPAPSGRVRDAIESVVDEAHRALVGGDHCRLGTLMNVNHGLLGALGVTTEPLDAACHAARAAGAWGAKMTGAGGGGCVFAVASTDAEQAVLDAWSDRGWQTFVFDIESSQS